MKRAFFLKYHRRGFTFLELIFVIVILGVLLGISIPQIKKTYNSLQLESFINKFTMVMSYLRQRSMVEDKIIYLIIDNDQKVYWVQMQGFSQRLKSFHIPKEITVEADKPEILFYPDGTIDKVTIKVSAPGLEQVSLTTRGVWGHVKIQTSS